MQSPFAGSWVLNIEKSRFDANHQPKGGRMTFETGEDGSLLMKAEGINEKGEKMAEQPQKFVPNGELRPIPGMPGLSVMASNPDPNTLQAEARREDGSVVGKGVYQVSADGRTLIATTSGFDTQLRRFEVQTVWERPTT